MECCTECEVGNHGLAVIRSSGAVVCACCSLRIAAYVIDDQRPTTQRHSFIEASRLNKIHMYPAFRLEK